LYSNRVRRRAFQPQGAMPVIISAMHDNRAAC
jgi:hypothetical protein